jgi:hypothetical protein
MQPRRLTVSGHYPESRSTRSHHLPPTPMPFLRLQGRWLDEAGFAIGTNVRVVVTRGQLVVEAVQPAHGQQEK